MLDSWKASRPFGKPLFHFADFENCKNVMMKLRWPVGIVRCPHCGSSKVTYLASRLEVLHRA